MPAMCIIEGCSKPPTARKFCNTHYRQFSRGQLDETGKALKKVRKKRANGSATGFCNIEGCSNPPHAHGICNTHLSQRRLGIIDTQGKPLRAKITKRGSKRTVTPKGYVKLFLPEHPRANTNGYVFEHIVVLERKLDRPLLPGELGHHLNGDRSDNRPENLELRTTATHEPAHYPDVKIAIETLETSTEPWDKQVLASLISGKPIDMASNVADPLGGLCSELPYKGKDCPEGPQCVENECTRPAQASRGLCWMHYSRWRRGKPTEGIGSPGLPAGFCYNASGYVLVRLPSHPCSMINGYALVHRAVMSNFLQRPLEDFEIVHHRDGNRANNRIENLQLMTSKENGRGYIRRPDQALRYICATWPASIQFLDRLQKLL